MATHPNELRSILRTPCAKVCGITRRSDARAAVVAGADLVGVISERIDSPRSISREHAAEVLAECRPELRVLVAIAASSHDLLREANDVGASIVQLCGPAASEAFRDFPLPILRSLPADEPAAFEAWDGVAEAFVIEPAGSIGGSGELAAPQAVRGVAAGRRCLLAGGLDGLNVVARIAASGLVGADASSRLESSPGIKDGALVRQFIDAVHSLSTRARCAR